MGISSTINNDKLDKPEEACGVFGILAPGKEVAKTAYYGLMALQHRGQESAGIISFDFNYFRYHKEMGLVHEVFNEKNLEQLNGNIAIAHTRYSTMGLSNLDNAQPYIKSTLNGSIALAHNGNLVNAVDLRKELTQKGIKLTTTSDSEIITNLIVENINNGLCIENSLTEALNKCVGAFSIVIGTKDYLIAAKDPYGIRPLCLGVTVGGDIVIASETCSLDIINANFVREIEPGEIVIIDLNKKISSIYYTEKRKNNLCLFEIIYFARPDSTLYGKSVYNYRFSLGQELAKLSPVDADIVIPIPDSGTIAGIGYSYASKIPIAKGMIKNRNIGRTFIQPTQEIRAQGIKLKLNPIKDVIKDKKIVVVDDSIVRGNTSKKIVELLRNNGAKEVHMRISSAPIKYPCYYGIDTDNSDQLIASGKNINEINDYIKADSLSYLTVPSMLKVCNNLSFCNACFSGKYPIDSVNCHLINKSVFEKINL
ncbi:MAG: amidophosphoribosyltransferase [Cyanobacteriota bacterium]